MRRRHVRAALGKDHPPRRQERIVSTISSSENGAVLVRAADAERVGHPPQTVQLLVDSAATGGKLSAQRVTLRDGADGARPHHHAGSAELFFVLSGSAQLLAGERLLLAGEGDVAVVPAGMSHAFAAQPGADTDLLIVIAPGVERFEYFRHLARIAAGELPPESLLAVQERYDTFFEASPVWEQARSV
jgi:mannose-6-phosphate isomerase-like protein (cupin superfamily)